MRDSVAFELLIRCENCERESVRTLTVPPVDGAPDDAESLLESGVMSGIRYSCRKCASIIGRLVQVQQVRSDRNCLEGDIVYDAAY